MQSFYELKFGELFFLLEWYFINLSFTFKQEVLKLTRGKVSKV